MSAARSYLGTLTILSGATTSGKLSSLLSQGQLAAALSAADLVIYGPAALTGSVVLQLAPKAAGTFKTYQIAGTDFAIPANKATTIPTAAFGDLQLLSGSSEASDRVFDLVAQSSL